MAYGYQTQASSGGGGGGTTIQHGTVALVAGTQSYPVVFTTPFGAPPGLFAATVQMVNSSGEVFFVTADLSSLTTTGATVWLNGVPTAASAGSLINWEAAE